MRGVSAGARPAWLAARPVGGGRAVEISSRLILRAGAADLPAVLASEPDLRVLRWPDDRTVLLEAGDALSAVRAAARLSLRPGVEAAMPILRKKAALHFPYAPQPSDPYFSRQTYLETLDPVSGFLSTAADLRIRSAWPWSRGTGVTVAVVDEGVELSHADLAPNVVPGHFNFVTGTSDGRPSTQFQTHGTAVAGILAARGGNHLGISGTAPDSRLVSWVIFDAIDNLPTDDQLAAMFEKSSTEPGLVAVQNHSWGNSDFDVLPMSLVETLAISNAITSGRGSLGTVFVRSAGNNRTQDYDFVPGVGDANLDAYASDYRQMTVAAVRNDGRVASYSSPGACVWVAAMGGDFLDPGSPGLFTTDRSGALGANSTADPSDPSLWDYAFGSRGFAGTSASAPQVSGIVALVLSMRPDLGWRDVQQLIALSARHVDLADPTIATNGAGFRISHNVGFGIPDAGVATRLARTWKVRPPAIVAAYTNLLQQAIPDDGLRVMLSGATVPVGGVSFGAAGSVGLHPDSPTRTLPLYPSTQVPSPAPFPGEFGVVIAGTPASASTAINAAADQGAAFAVVTAFSGTDNRSILRDTGFVRIPAVQIGHDAGQQLQSWLTQPASVNGQLRLQSAEWSFAVQDPLLVEHVQVTLNWQHPRMQDLRVTLRSPSGTISVLHRPGASTNPVPSPWTYGSSLHMGESSQGVWTLAVTDEASGATGSVDSVVLRLHGVPLVDADADGLDDNWEREHFGSLNYGPVDDPDGDGWSNAAEQLSGTDPTRDDAPLVLNADWNGDGRLRLSWPGRNGAHYEVLVATAAGGEWTTVQSIAGRFPETGWVVSEVAVQQFFRVRQVP